LIPENCKDLEAHQKLMVYEGIGYMVSTEQIRQHDFVLSLLSYSHKDWEATLQRATQDPSVLMSPDCIRSIDHIIKINQRVAQSTGRSYIAYLSQIFSPLIQVYKHYSSWISQAQQSGGASEHLVRPMKTVRRDILKLIQTYIEKETDFDYFNQNFLPTLQAMVEDYQ